ncbi:MAG: VPLPA-CTERM sorting domain-containing protein [Oceanobacter sp.]
MFNRVIKQSILAIGLACSATIANAALIESVVSSRDNLFYTDWNGFFNPVDLPDYQAPGSQAAQSLNFDFVANGITTFKATVTGEVVDAGIYATGPDGCPDPNAPCYFNPNGNNGIYNYNPAYSVIGVWSTTPDVINFITPDGGSSWIDALVSVGSGGIFDVPEGYGSAYLFLAENDGNFLDNDPVGNYSVSISQVPLPAAAWLLGTALLGLIGVSRRQRAS